MGTDTARRILEELRDDPDRQREQEEEEQRRLEELLRRLLRWEVESEEL